MKHFKTWKKVLALSLCVALMSNSVQAVGAGTTTEEQEIEVLNEVAETIEATENVQEGTQSEAATEENGGSASADASEDVNVSEGVTSREADTEGANTDEAGSEAETNTEAETVGEAESETNAEASSDTDSGVEEAETEVAGQTGATEEEEAAGQETDAEGQQETTESASGVANEEAATEDKTEALKPETSNVPEKVRFDYHSKLVNVIVTLQDESDLPEDAELVVTPVELTAEMQESLDEKVSENGKVATAMNAFDIKFVVDGKEVEPGDTVKVQISLPEVEAGDDASVYHIDETSEKVEDMNAVVSEEGNVEFDTTHFSVYVIVNNSNKELKVTIRHFNSKTKEKIYADDVLTLQYGGKIKDYNKAVNWLVEGVTTGEGEETNVDTDKELTITSDTTINVYYKADKKTYIGDVTFYDYDVVRGSVTEGINKRDNYSNKDKKYDSKRLAVGEKGNSWTGEKDSPNEYSATINNIDANSWQQTNATKGIVTGLTEDFKTVIFSLDEPGLFTEESKEGKKVYKDYDLIFEQEGDTYTLTHVKNSEDNVTTNAGANFLPLNDLVKKGEKNFYFGMRYDIEFKLGDYVGPLTYNFTGDDDLWVILDGKKVVIDLGGIHNAISGSTNLWEQLGIKPGELKAEDKEKTHRLTILYMERGAGESNCSMKFTIPNAKILSVTKPTTTDLNFSKTNSSNVGLEGATFKLVNDTTKVETVAVSDTQGLVRFTDLVVGNYTLTEIVAPEGYVKSAQSWKVKVTETADSLKAKLYNDLGAEITSVVNHTVQEELNSNLTIDKTAKLVDWDKREYQIEITAKSNKTTISTVKKAVDVMMVLDISTSMSGKVKNTAGETVTRLEALKEAATIFVNQLNEKSPESNVGVSWFNENGGIKLGLTTVNDGNLRKIENAIKELSISDVGTKPNNALKLVDEAFESFQANGNEKYIILFSDGEVNSTTAKTETEELAKKLKEDGYTIFTVGFALTGDVAEWLKGKVATKGCAFTANTVEGLNAIFANLHESVTGSTTIANATITDVIDARFELAEGEVARLEKDYPGQVTIKKNDDGTTTVTWSAQTIGTQGNTWYLNVVAKEDFIGGNNVTTNVSPESKIEAEGAEKVLPQPTVNVKAEFAVSDVDNTIFLGEAVSIEEELLKNLFNLPNQEGKPFKNYKGELDKFTLEWFKDEACKEADKITLDEMGKVVPESTEDIKKFYLKVTLKVEEATEESIANSTVGETSYVVGENQILVADDTGCYTTYIVDGTIKITKLIPKSSYVESEGDPIFTFKVTNQVNDVEYYRTVRFDMNDENTVCVPWTGDEAFLCVSATIENLPQGIYEVKELATMGFELKNMINDGNYSNIPDTQYKEESSYVCALGFDMGEHGNSFENASECTSTANDNHIKYTQAGVVVTNDKSRNPGKETDTDVVKNTLVVGMKPEENYDADNESPENK